MGEIRRVNWDTLRIENALPVEVHYDDLWGLYPQLILKNGNLEWQINHGSDDNLTIDYYDGSSTTTFVKFNKTLNRIEFSKQLYMMDNIDLGAHYLLNAILVSFNAVNSAPMTSGGRLWAYINPDDTSKEFIMWNYGNNDIRYLFMSPAAQDLDMNNFAIKNLKDPVDNQDAATKNYVDTQISNAISSKDEFIELNDTPSTYSGYGGQFVRVKETEDGLEFVSVELSDEKVKADSSDPTSGYLVDKVDNATLEVDTENHVVRVKDRGITEPKLADNSVSTRTIQNGAVTTSKINIDSNLRFNGYSIFDIRGIMPSEIKMLSYLGSHLLNAAYDVVKYNDYLYLLVGEASDWENLVPVDVVAKIIKVGIQNNKAVEIQEQTYSEAHIGPNYQDSDLRSTINMWIMNGRIYVPCMNSTYDTNYILEIDPNDLSNYSLHQVNTSFNLVNDSLSQKVASITGDGTYLYVALGSNIAKIDTSTWSVVSENTLSYNIGPIRYDPDTGYIFALGYFEGFVLKIDPSTLDVVEYVSISSFNKSTHHFTMISGDYFYISIGKKLYRIKKSDLSYEELWNFSGYANGDIGATFTNEEEKYISLSPNDDSYGNYILLYSIDHNIGIVIKKEYTLFPFVYHGTIISLEFGFYVGGIYQYVPYINLFDFTRLNNLPDPIYPQEAATKQYVDSTISSKRYYTTATIPSTAPYEVTIAHNLNDLAPTYVVYDDSTGEQIEPANVTVIDANTLKLEFGSEDAGKTIRVKVIA